MSLERPHDPNEVREWIFTFGFGQELAGMPMKNRFCRIRGTFDSARAEMVRRFGKTWSFQYGSEDEAGVERFRLEEYELPEVPA